MKPFIYATDCVFVCKFVCFLNIWQVLKLEDRANESGSLSPFSPSYSAVNQSPIKIRKICDEKEWCVLDTIRKSLLVIGIGKAPDSIDELKFDGWIGNT